MWPFKKKPPTDAEARELMRRARMRRVLFEFLWKEERNSRPWTGVTVNIPMPQMNDAEVRRELKRILDE